MFRNLKTLMKAAKVPGLYGHVKSAIYEIAKGRKALNTGERENFPFANSEYYNSQQWKTLSDKLINHLLN